jgi:hypothetical protein
MGNIYSVSMQNVVVKVQGTVQGSAGVGPVHESDKTSSHTTFELGKPLKNFIIPIACSPNATLNVLKVFIALYPTLKQNFLQALCSFKSAIL